MLGARSSHGVHGLGAILPRGLVKRVLLASPRGYCAGVERAVDTVDRALKLYGAPVYVRKQIVRNSHVVRELQARGAVFVESVHDVPAGAPVVFSAHGVSPAVRKAAAGYRIVFSGHAGHEEVEGTMGEAADRMVLVQTVADAKSLELPRGPLAYITQTTLSVDETREIIDVLRARFPHIEGPAKEDICYATTNRQQAVKELVGQVDVLLVIGSRNSSNSKRLVEVARSAGVRSHLVDDACEIDDRWLATAETVGITSGASAPERLVRDVCDWFRARGVTDIAEHGRVAEDVAFKLPVELRRAERSAA